MKTNPYVNHSFNTRVLFFALALVLWASFTYAEHQVDYDQAHHQQHQCQLYTTAENGLTPSIAIPPVIPQGEIDYQSFSSDTVVTPLPAQRARAPPKTS